MVDVLFIAKVDKYLPSDDREGFVKEEILFETPRSVLNFPPDILLPFLSLIVHSSWKINK